MEASRKTVQPHRYRLNTFVPGFNPVLGFLPVATTAARKPEKGLKRLAVTALGDERTAVLQ